MQIRDKGIKAAYTQAIKDNNISPADATKLLDAARDGNTLSKNERRDLEGILTQQSAQMAPEAQQSIKNFLNACSRHDHSDMEPAPTPTITQSRAFERGKKDATFRQDRPAVAPRRPFRGDPVYIELHNVEMGAKFEFINLSAKPDANFEVNGDVQELKITGRDIQNRQAGVYLSQAQMKKLGIEPGDMYQLRAVDHSGNPSLPVTGEFEPDDWNNGWVQEGGERFRGSQLSALDGESVRKNLIMKTVNDSRPPLVLEDKISLVGDCRFDDNDKGLANQMRGQWNNMCKIVGKQPNSVLSKDDLLKALKDTSLPLEFRKEVKALIGDKERFNAFDTANRGASDNNLSMNDLNLIRAFKPSVTLTGFAAIEPRTEVNVLNTRTGETFSATVDDERNLSLNLGDVKDGDPLVMTPTDNEGVAGKQMELVYSTNAPGGKAPKIAGGLGIRLPGVL